jgi:hypothetical protein
MEHVSDRIPLSAPDKSMTGIGLVPLNLAHARRDSNPRNRQAGSTKSPGAILADTRPGVAGPKGLRPRWPQQSHSLRHMLVQGRLAKATAVGKSLKFREFRPRAVHRRLLFSRGKPTFFWGTTNSQEMAYPKCSLRQHCAMPGRGRGVTSSSMAESYRRRTTRTERCGGTAGRAEAKTQTPRQYPGAAALR